ncbi:MAG: hypothetical protein A2W52_01750 [Candidatus Taylorbacteria bacterium RIFCSPHIGHO2_02_49_25]|uniref:Uncharacterized protein n=1 Tax=Candidatus Taylorbacteria bacterium RIFCSPHIGHO2_02_49_25 TaxID=1802305 RepID=A0A1G2MB51_9BACT|nr:MAG: hypothetical protein UY62_C0010G0021 [Parcubacteria group bacterium GW2011_GWF2_50_9]OHA19173.1 MAG: hypothetical protein A2759_00590 [Candidatus Taylorbacteria bacterium RIFCSPHIGHO2_01_FULL_49_60]OHA21116.1 MAG: hypothetical protein A2W52_01750 [Candidatus Taylorbacteria bacterium RIFCSPHIGHO2_02_49_25]OHA46554.1 MAG: hypothetical protein A3G61_01785 [Candidatus Taylorbacteria bacterium RIFCSPLOWO2_12_FULL_49_67]
MKIETPRPNPELGLLYLAGALEDAGFHADILDATVGTRDDRLDDTFRKPVMQDSGLIRIGMTVSRLSEVIAKGGYGVVGINSNFTPQTKMALEVARATKAVSRDIFVVVGGVNARALAERFLQSGAVDAICLTEGERIAVNLMRTLAKEQDLAKVSGIAHLLDGKVVRQPVAPTDVCQNLDELPFPRWEKLPFFHYDELAPRAVLALGSDRFGSLMTSRGCWAKCLYCHISSEKEHALETGNIGGLRFKSINRVMEEARRLQELGVKKLYFEDDTLLAKKRRICEIFTRIRDMGFQIADVNGVNLVHFLKREGSRLTIDREFLLLLKEAGFNQIVFPVESASQRIVDKYATGKLDHKNLNVVELVRVAASIGITCPINMMIGFPDETEEEMRSSIELGKRLVEAGSAYCTPFIPIPFPGCMLYDYAVANGHLASDFDPDIFNWKNAVMKNTVVPPERVLELRDFAHEYMNTPEYVRARKEASAGTFWEKRGAELQKEIGLRWQSGAPVVTS